jgi:hypothetical protein
VEQAEQAPVPAATARVPVFAPPDIVWYFGAWVAAIAGSSLVLQTSPADRGLWMVLVGLATMAVLGAFAAVLLAADLHVPGGVFAAAAVWVVPATCVGVEHLFGVHPQVGGSETRITVGPVGVPRTPGGFHGAPFAIALATAAAGLAVFWLVAFPFVLLPVALALAVAAELFVPAVVSHPGAGNYVTAAWVTGIVFFVAGLALDVRGLRRVAFWWYVVGLFEIAVAFVYYLGFHHEWVWFLLLVVAALLLLVSAPLGRATWASYAVVGVFVALAHYVTRATGSWRTPALVALVGVAFVLVGIVLEQAGSRLVSRVAPRWRPPLA